MQRAQIQDAVRTLIEEGWNKGRLEVLDDLVAEEYRRRGPAVDIKGRAGWKRHITAVRSLFPDFHVEIHDVLAAGACGIARFTATLTHSSPYLGVTPTGHKVSFDGIVMVRFEDGLLAEEWEITDRPAAFQELAAIAAQQADPRD
jgi:predicted ester cyclase